MERRSRRGRTVLLEGGAAILLACGLIAWAMNRASSTGALVQVADHQVAVVVDNRTGDPHVRDTPGMLVLRPWLQDAYVIDKSPLEYRMVGNERKNDNLVPRLSVRSADGSTFWFQRVTVRYAIRPDLTSTVLTDIGADYAWHHGTLDAFARGVLRDAFGRFTSEEIVRTEHLRTAANEAKARLNELLEPHGLAVLELSTTKPAFAKEYEAVVHRRRVADEEIEKLVQELEQMQASREARLAQLEREKQLEESQMRAEEAQQLAAARREAIRTRAEADRFHDRRVREGERERDGLLSRADAMSEQYAKEAEGFREKAEALAAQGELAVRKALIESLGRVQLEIAPFERAGLASSSAADTAVPKEF